MTIELCTHAYSDPRLDNQYGILLHYQIASMYLDPPDHHTTLTVCFAHRKHDPGVNDVMDFWMGVKLPDTLSIFPNRMHLPRLFRRAIGREQFCKSLNYETLSVVFLDVDYCLRPPFLNKLGELAKKDLLEPLAVPAFYNICNNHEKGDEYIASAIMPPYMPNMVTFPLPSIDPEDFHQRPGKNIGGQMILRGDFAREHGYCRGTKRLREVDPAGGFTRCRCDVDARRCWKPHAPGGWGRIDADGMYRLRHTRDGRDYTLSAETAAAGVV